MYINKFKAADIPIYDRSLFPLCNEKKRCARPVALISTSLPKIENTYVYS